jgi:hypothetical protein
MQTTSFDFEPNIIHVIELLEFKKYEELENLTKGIRLTSEQIKNAIEGYGKTIIRPGIELNQLIDAIEVKDKMNKSWSVNVALWTKEEGRSDLTLELTVIKQGNNQCNIEIENIHVL